MTHQNKATGWPSFWQKITWISIFLLPFGGVYLALRAFHQWWRQQHIYWAGVPVISFGNITVGGNGKTPLVLHTAEMLLKENPNRPVALVLRGYGGSITEPHCVLQHNTAAEVGDEAVLLFQRLAGHSKTTAKVSIWVGQDRAAVVRAAEMAGAQIILLDDGFQRDDVGRNLDIVVFDGTLLFGNNLPLPAGPLREHKKALKRADFGVIFNAKTTDYIGLPCYRLTLKQDLSAVKKRAKLLPFCGIGQPQKFFRQLEETFPNTLQGLPFPDHYTYTHEDLTALIQQAKAEKAQLVTTEKDMVKIPPFFHKHIAVIPVDVAGEDWDEIMGEIHKVL